MLLVPLAGFGNNLTIDSLELTGPDRIRFRVSWENSWNYTDSLAPFNRDGAWLFCKGRSADDGNWRHLRISAAEWIGGPGADLRVAGTGTGVMALPAGRGDGDFTGAVVELRLETASLMEGYTALRVFGIEMVEVPEGPFYAGDSASNNTFVTAGGRLPYRVASEAAVPCGPEAGKLWSAGDFTPQGNAPAAFPKGYAAFYTMKYEISQAQYAAFLNTLSSGQVAANRLSTLVEAPCFGSDHITGERNYLTEVDGVFGCDANGNGILNEAGDGGDVACNFLSWSQLTAYLDWAGLRPMTELEYEKAGRGGEYPLPLGFAWGSDQAVNTLETTGLATAAEHCTNEVPAGHGLANFGYCLPSGPLRCGFAAFSATGRVPTGASYYGIMELSGNLWELCVVLTSAGLRFTGEHGDGELDASGREDAWNWLPGAGGHRGGAWNSGILPGFRDLAVSDRFFAFVNPDALIRGTSGGRGVISKTAFE